MEKTAERVPNILAPRSKGMTALEMLQLPNEMRTKILTVKQHDHVLVETDIWKSCSAGYEAWAREMEAHTSPGKRMGSAVRYTDPETKQVWTFEIPTGPLRKAKDSILLANADDCEVQVKKNRIAVHVAEGKISVVENFPVKDGWYPTDLTFGVPVNVPLYSDASARHLYRIDMRVGPVARSYGFGGYDGWRYVSVDNPPSLRLGVLVEETVDSISEQIKEAAGQ